MHVFNFCFPPSSQYPPVPLPFTTIQIDSHTPNCSSLSLPLYHGSKGTYIYLTKLAMFKTSKNTTRRIRLAQLTLLPMLERVGYARVMQNTGKTMPFHSWIAPFSSTQYHSSTQCCAKISISMSRLKQWRTHYTSNDSYIIIKIPHTHYNTGGSHWKPILTLHPQLL